jgi:anti-sigma regulatory factor (Ser/Thr protein kinase)
MRTMHVALSRDPRSAGSARHLVSTMVAGTACEVAADTAELLVSELVGNAVRYGREPVELDISCAGNRLEVGVKDSGERRPQVDRQRCAAARDAELPEGGRGLCLIEDLAARWGTDPLSGSEAPGKRVWFVIDTASA